ncbi:helix-turn-helix domain-containing protein [Anabaena sp. FACHB-1237]|uniref:helix-turn-helix domain-containing protein n=1 Tax=Anabaena sp. FACHB-1237 TaxID=2692769 RepID=UPI001F54D9ED|nr:helix-turn-helix domain-containing protein [Anabaena sp. FACHB-1237]
MLLGFKTELKVNKQQRLLLEQHAGVATQAWNQGLALCQQVLIDNKLNPQDKIKFPTAIDLHKWLVAAVKSCHPWYYQVSKCTPQYELRYLSEANIRKDTLHKITTCISKNHAVIGIEDLNVSGMLANGKLSKAIADMGCDQFRRQLEYKT